MKSVLRWGSRRGPSDCWGQFLLLQDKSFNCDTKVPSKVTFTLKVTLIALRQSLATFCFGTSKYRSVMMRDIGNGIEACMDPVMHFFCEEDRRGCRAPPAPEQRAPPRDTTVSRLGHRDTHPRVISPRYTRRKPFRSPRTPLASELPKRKKERGLPLRTDCRTRLGTPDARSP